MPCVPLDPNEVVSLLRNTIAAELNELEHANTSRPVPTVAWISRSLLELAIWTSYCLLSPENATRFGEDSARDLTDALKLSDEFSRDSNFSFATVRAELIAKGKEDGFEDIDQRYTCVAEAASVVGLKQRYLQMNKLLSKFAHPTALRLVAPQELVERFRKLFYEAGKMWGTDAINMIDRITEIPAGSVESV